MSELPRVAILDDFQKVAIEMADWSALDRKVEMRSSTITRPIRKRSSSAFSRSSWSA